MDESTLFVKGLENHDSTDFREKPEQAIELKCNSEMTSQLENADRKTGRGNKCFKSVIMSSKLKAISQWYDDRFMPPELLKKFSKKQIMEYKGAYKMFDKDSDGVISVGEVVTVLRSLGQDPSEEQVQMLFAKYDNDGSGEIEFPEFIRLVSKIQESEEKEEDLVEVFRVLDQDGDGQITKSDLRAVIKRIGSDLTNQDIEDMINEGDKDGDGTIEFEEFAKLIMSR